MAYNFSNISILVVEDDQIMKVLLANILKTLKVKECYTANNGDEGLTLFKRHEPDVVITDWNMPDGDGIELIKNIRRLDKSNKKKALTPILLTSGKTSEKLLKDALNAGVTEYLSKPFSITDIAKRIEYMLAKPRECIDIETYFGPSRRRRTMKEYSGPLKREEDKT